MKKMENASKEHDYLSSLSDEVLLEITENLSLDELKNGLGITSTRMFDFVSIFYVKNTYGKLFAVSDFLEKELSRTILAIDRYKISQQESMRPLQGRITGRGILYRARFLTHLSLIIMAVIKFWNMIPLLNNSEAIFKKFGTNKLVIESKQGIKIVELEQIEKVKFLQYIRMAMLLLGLVTITIYYLYIFKSNNENRLLSTIDNKAFNDLNRLLAAEPLLILLNDKLQIRNHNRPLLQNLFLELDVATKAFRDYINDFKHYHETLRGRNVDRLDFNAIRPTVSSHGIFRHVIDKWNDKNANHTFNQIQYR